MPLTWKRGENPYRSNYFAVLGVGPETPAAAVAETSKKIVAKIGQGKPHEVAGRPLDEAKVMEAETRLLDEPSWAAEVLLVHPVPPRPDPTKLRDAVARLRAASAPSAPPAPRLVRPEALAALIPVPGSDLLDWPAWEELGISAPALEDDVPFDV